MFFRFFTLIFFALIRKSRILILNSRIFQYFQRWWGASMLWVVLVLFESNIETCQWEWAWVHGKAFPLDTQATFPDKFVPKVVKTFSAGSKKQADPAGVRSNFFSAFSSLQLKSCTSF